MVGRYDSSAFIMSCIVVGTELKGLTKKSSKGENPFPCIISGSAPVHKKLLFSVLPRKKDASMQN